MSDSEELEVVQKENSRNGYLYCKPVKRNVEINWLKDTNLVEVLLGNEIVTFGTDIYKLTSFSQVVNGKNGSPN